MTDKTNNDAPQSTETGSSDLFNTAAGWVLFAAGLGLGLSYLSAKHFDGTDPERPETVGYVIEGVEEDVDEVEMTMTQALSMEGVDVSAGEKVFAKCVACHTIDAGGANGTGPNLHGIMGANVGAVSGYEYSTAMTSFGGQWGWDEMNDWLNNPRSYMDGTKMGFAGLSKIEDRAAVALYMNENGSNLPVPEYVAVAAEEAEAIADEVAEVEGNQEAAESTSEETAAAQAGE
ncbi:c-type cytochrome [Erythrobacter sp. Alg231-14]|uniref:c-type cytochrome n=1 Tax=Erythrobacter sp. Alg231-14 TaxID=1922225 RepID=UPI000D556EB1